MPRLHCGDPLENGLRLALPAGAARHVQVLRLQPGDPLTLFDGRGGEYEALVEHMGRSEVRVAIGAHHAIEREAPVAVHLALAMPANERMDWLVEKATELGVASIQPLVAERSVLRLAGERAQKKQGHWQSVAIAACEQCGRNRIPAVQPLTSVGDYRPGEGMKVLLSPQARLKFSAALKDATAFILAAGPEAGFTAEEEAAFVAAGFVPVSLGPRVLRTETASVAALAALNALRGDS